MKREKPGKQGPFASTAKTGAPGCPTANADAPGHCPDTLAGRRLGHRADLDAVKRAFRESVIGPLSRKEPVRGGAICEVCGIGPVWVGRLFGWLCTCTDPLPPADAKVLSAALGIPTERYSQAAVRLARRLPW